MLRSAKHEPPKSAQQNHPIDSIPTAFPCVPIAAPPEGGQGSAAGAGVRRRAHPGPPRAAPLLDPNAALVLASGHKGAANRGEHPMVDRFVARHNIEHFRDLIAKETDKGTLRTLRRSLLRKKRS